MSDEKLAEFSVAIGMPIYSGLPWQTGLALARTTHHIGLLKLPTNIHVVAGSSLPHIARDVVLTNYITGPERFLFWIDSDVVWTPEQFFRVLRLTKDLGVVAGTYPVKRDPPECILNYGDFNPTPNKYGCVQVAGLGLGFTCVRRDVIDEFVATKDWMYHPGQDRMILDAFRCDTQYNAAHDRKEGRGEDGAFFADLRALGHKVWLDPTIELGHVGTKEYRMKLEQYPSVHLQETPDGAV